MTAEQETTITYYRIVIAGTDGREKKFLDVYIHPDAVGENLKVPYKGNFIAQTLRLTLETFPCYMSCQFIDKEGDQYCTVHKSHLCARP